MSYKTLGDYIQPVNIRNTELKVETLLGVSIKKILMPSIANTIGTNMKNYKIIRKNQFAYGPVTSRNGDKISIALLEEYNEAIVSQAYTVFEVVDDNKLLPEYLMMWFRRLEFDRYARFKSHGSARETFDWDELCEVTLPIPSIEKQQQIVDEYNTVTHRIQLNEKINTNLEATAQALYKHWFVDFEFPIDLCQSELVEDPNCHLEHVTSSTSPRAQSRGEKREVSLETLNKIDFTKGYKSSGGKMVYNEELDQEIPEWWSVEKLETFTNLKYGKMLNSDLFIEKGYPVFSGYGIRGYYSEYMYEDEQILVLCRGVSGTGRVELSPKNSYITNLSIVVESDFIKTKKMFLYYYLKNDNLRELDSGSAQSQITTGDLGFRKILVPNINIQIIFEKHLASIYEVKEVINYEDEKLKDLQSLLLAKMTQDVTKTVEINI